MPQSLAAVYLHLVFSTKERRLFLQDRAMREELHKYIGGVSKTLECAPIRIGGVEDHVHVLARFGRTLSIAEWVKELKRLSSIWVHERGPLHAGFQWQNGYGVFSVSRSKLDDVTAYVEGQEDHHRRMSFQDELRAMLRKHGMEYDERYLWD
jgi:REP element-mobilizing transposase RayT